MFKHIKPVRDTERERPAAASFSDHDRNYRHPQPGHLHKAGRDGLSLAPFFRADPGVRSGCVHEGDDGPPEFLGKLHQTLRLPVTLWIGLPEIAPDPLFGAASFLMPYNDNGMAVYLRYAAYYLFVF